MRGKVTTFPVNILTSGEIAWSSPRMMSVLFSQGPLPFDVRNVLDACDGYTLVLRRFNVPLSPHANWHDQSPSFRE